MTTFPPRNLPGEAEKWGRAIEEAIAGTTKQASIAKQLAGNANNAVDSTISAGSDTKLELNYEIQRNEETREKLAAAEELIENTRGELEDARENFDDKFAEHDKALQNAYGTNLIPNGNGDRGKNGGWYGKLSGEWSLTWAEGDAPAGLPGRFVVDENSAILNPIAEGVELTPVEPGQEYLFEAWLRDPEGPRTFKTAISLVTVDGSVIDLIPDSLTPVPGLEMPIVGTPPVENGFVASNWDPPATWTRIGAQFVPPEGVTEVGVYALLGGGEIAGVRLTKMVRGENLEGSSAAGRLGPYIDLMTQYLTVNGVANIGITVTDELYARMAVVEKLQALEGIITTDMVATGAITASEITVTEELTAAIAQFLTIHAEDVNVGRDARWWSGGLVFYAPPAEDQDPTDWENRIPLIALTPAGDVSIAVAQDGGITAGITPTGEIWGRRGAFDELDVAGESIEDILDRGARGILKNVVLSSDTNVTTTSRILFSIVETLRPNRTYRITMSVNWFGAGTYYKEIRFNQGGPGGLGNTVQYTWTVPTNPNEQITECTFVFTSDDRGITAPTDYGIVMSIRSDATGNNKTVRSSNHRTFMRLEDVGPAIEKETVRVAPGVVPTTTRTATITSQPGVPIRPNGTFAPDGRRMVGGQSQGYGSDMSEHVYYPLDLSRLAGSTILDAKVSFQVTSTKYGGTPVALRWDVTTGFLNGRVNFYNGAHGVGGATGTASANTRQSFVGRAGVLVTPLYPGNSTQGYGGVGERVTLTVTYRK